MKRLINSAIDDFDEEDEFEEEPDNDFSREEIVPAIMAATTLDEELAEIIYDWYDEEDAWDDFENVREFIIYMRDDLANMIDACDDDELKETFYREVPWL